MQTFPLRPVTKPLFHVGVLEGVGSQAPAPRFSHEGHCLSVSMHPEIWRKIARCSGHVYALSRPGAQLLSMHDTLRNARLLGTAMDWAQAQGLVEKATLYELREGDEDGEECISLHASHKQAADEACDEEADIVAREGWVGTDTLQRLACFPSPVPLAFVVDMAVIQYADQVLRADGVWWNDRLAPHSLSAPRGGIFRPREWSIRRIEKASAPTPLHGQGLM